MKLKQVLRCGLVKYTFGSLLRFSIGPTLPFTIRSGKIFCVDHFETHAHCSRRVLKARRGLKTLVDKSGCSRFYVQVRYETTF